MAYTPSGSLGRDPAHLLLAVLSRLWGDLSNRQRELLLTAIVQPHRPITNELPGVVAEVLTAVYGSASSLLFRSGPDTWRWQFLLAILARAVVLATSDNLGPARRRWLTRLAGFAGRELIAGRGLPFPGNSMFINYGLMVDRWTSSS